MPVLAVLACAAAPLEFRTRGLPWAAVGSNYAATFEVRVDARCPRSDVSLAVVEGALPRGLELEGNGFTGVPRETGTFHLRVRAANICGAIEQDFTLLVTGKPILRVTPDEVAIEYHTDGPMPPPRTILVSSTWPELPYSVSGDSTWLHASQREGLTPGPGSAFAGDVVSVEADPKGLPPGTYETTLTFSTYQGAVAPEIRVRLTVVPGLGTR
jgi:hypothetical protein